MNSQKKLKLMLASLKDREFHKFFSLLSSQFANNLKKSVRQISFNCYESVCEFEDRIVSGYGKNVNQAYTNSIRTLVDLLTNDTKMHRALKQSLKLVSNNTATLKLFNFDSEKTDPNYNSSKQAAQPELPNSSPVSQPSNQPIYASLQPANPCPPKKRTLKEQIFEYLNLDNLKISNPNVSKKPKEHQQYMNQSSIEASQGQQELDLQDPVKAVASPSQQLIQILSKNNQLEKKIDTAKNENKKLKNLLNTRNQCNKSLCWIESGSALMGHNEHLKPKQTIKDNVCPQQKARESYEPLKARESCEPLKARESCEPLKTRTNQLLNTSNDMRLRSASMGPKSETHKYPIHKNITSSQTIDKKITVPKLNLQVLPNYHGKSNKSLNQSLMEMYEKTRNK